jgi:hypothetical protein
VLDILHFAHARGDRKPVAFRNLEFGIAGAKFTAALPPGQACRLTFERRGDRVRFACEAEGRSIAAGLISLIA